ncbi:hypothetical protein QJS04_geneDACA011048 [Acorus gramineus]|uniref:Membrane protein YuiD n=1 Tax=Acorus gramineus TaxID=55184 RepID=A0AAV9BI49_ACOGR|nr:hypothetical protein QJS04_geneDACA011048 [Acorus gramineus]
MFAASTLPFPTLSVSPSKRQQRLHRPNSPFICLHIGVEDVVEIAQNKVLIATTLSSAIGQLSKPFTSGLSGNAVDFKAAFRSGGMPSTHSAAVVAAATSLGLERGLSDSIFGMSVVFAALVMYDAQGVRREVGNHAKVLNRLIKLQEIHKKNESLPSINSECLTPLLTLSEKANSRSSNPESVQFQRSPNALSGPPPSSLSVGEESSETSYKYELLNESVGHTELQVLVGAILGFIISILIDIAI